jgi:CRP-like cAMP-binding protein
VNSEDLDLLRSVGSESKLGAGHTLIEHGQHGAGLFVILEGTVVIEAPEGTRELWPGACVGERALFSQDGTRTARVRTTSDVRVLAVDRIAFEELCANDDSLAARVADAAR